jgi:hypothetical protein
MREGRPLDRDGPDQTATEYAMMPRLTSYALLAVLVLGTGLGIGLGLSEAPSVTSSPTGILKGGIEPWSEPSNVNLYLAGEVVVRRGGHVVANTYDAGGPFGFRFVLRPGSMR